MRGIHLVAIGFTPGIIFFRAFCMGALGRHRVLRTLLISVLVLLLIGGGAALWLKGNYKRIIQEKLPGISAKVTDTMYHIKARDVSIELGKRQIVITDFELEPNLEHIEKLKRDYNLPPVILSIKIPKLTIDGIVWARLLKSSVLECGHITALNPVIRVSKITAGPEQRDKKPRKPSKLEAILAGQVALINPEISYTDSTAKERSVIAAKGGGITLTGFKFELDKNNDSTRLLYSERTVVRFASFAIDDRAAVYKISTAGIEYDNASNHIGIAGLLIKPTISKEEFYRRTGFQKEIYDVSLPAISLEGFDWKKLLYGGAIVAQSGTLSKASINIYMDRAPPPNPYSKNGKFPHQLLMKLRLPVDIPLLNLRDGRFAYTERNQKTMEAGTVSMYSINGAVRNITNMPAVIRKDPVCSIHMAGIFKGSPIDATFRFVLGSKAGAFSVEGVLGAMDGVKLNDIIRPMALAELRSLQLNKVTFRIEGSEAGAKGSITMLYEDLKANLLKPDDGGFNKKDVTSFFANHVLTFDANPMPGKDVRTAHPQVERDAHKSFFNLVWKTIFNGVLETASRKLIKIDKLVNKRIEKQEAERVKNEPPHPYGRPLRKKGK